VVARDLRLGWPGNGGRVPDGGGQALGSWSMSRRQSERGGSVSDQASKEAVDRVRKRRWRLGEQGGDGGGVCASDLAVRENGGGRNRKTEEGTWQFPNPPIFIGCRSPRPYSLYIRRCYDIADEYTWIIFVGDVAPPMNI
jgi:hypothetical protein